MLQHVLFSFTSPNAIDPVETFTAFLLSVVAEQSGRAVVGARFLREDERIVTVAAGKVADLVVVRGDPSSKIPDIENVEIVFKDGIGYDSAKLIQSVRGLVGLR